MAIKKPKEESTAAYRLRVMQLVFDLLAEGRTLTSITTAVDGVPKYSTIMEWLNESQDLAERYARARSRQADYFAEQIVDIADTEPDPQVARVRMDARKWHASKTAPQKYGDKIFQEHSGKVNFATLTDAELEAIAAGQSEA